MNEARLQERIDYWTEKWSRHIGPGHEAACDVPYTDYDKETSVTRIGVETIRLDPELTEALRSFAHQRNLTTFIIFAAALSLTISLRTGRQLVLMRTPFSHRTRSETENLIGWFSNSQMISVDVSPELSLDQFLDNVREEILAASIHSDVPALVCQRRSGRIDYAASPLNRPAVWLDLLNRPLAPGFKGLTTSNVYLPHHIDMPLNFFVIDEEEFLTVVLKYDADQFTAASVQLAAEDLNTVLNQMLNVSSIADFAVRAVGTAAASGL